MDVNLESLIEKIKKEAIEEGQQAADAIVGKANEQAAAVVDSARTEAEQIVNDAQAEGEKLQENAKHALRQAARDVELLLKEQLTALFDRVFKRAVGAALGPEFLEGIILKLVDEWAKEGAVEVVVSQADKEQLEALLFSHLEEDLKQSVTLQASHAVARGFRFELKGGSVYSDFTDETIADALKAFINPSLQAILNAKDG